MYDPFVSLYVYISMAALYCMTCMGCIIPLQGRFASCQPVTLTEVEIVPVYTLPSSARKMPCLLTNHGYFQSLTNSKQHLIVTCIFPVSVVVYIIRKLCPHACLLSICISSVVALPILQNRFPFLVCYFMKTILQVVYY